MHWLHILFTFYMVSCTQCPSSCIVHIYALCILSSIWYHALALFKSGGTLSNTLHALHERNAYCLGQSGRSVILLVNQQNIKNTKLSSSHVFQHKNKFQHRLVFKCMCRIAPQSAECIEQGAAVPLKVTRMHCIRCSYWCKADAAIEQNAYFTLSAAYFTMIIRCTIPALTWHLSNKPESHFWGS